MEGKEKALKIAELALRKKAKDVVILDIKDISGLCDYFVICSADSGKQAEAIYSEVARKCRKENIKVQHFEKDQDSQWVLVDFSDVILHIFQDSVRSFYNLDQLWSSAKKIPYDE